MSQPVLLAWSGGKDSTLALAALDADPGVQVVGLLTAVTPAYDSISIHGVRRSILRAQSEALGLPVFEACLEPGASDAGYREAWAAAIQRAQGAVGPVQHIAYGDLFLEDVRAFREEQAQQMGMTTLFPLWGRATTTLAHDFVAAGYEAYLTCVDVTQLAAEFAGRRFDARLLSDLPDGVDPCGERGEFHTCVVNAPRFHFPISVVVGERLRREARFEYCDLIPM